MQFSLNRRIVFPKIPSTGLANIQLPTEVAMAGMGRAADIIEWVFCPERISIAAGVDTLEGSGI